MILEHQLFSRNKQRQQSYSKIVAFAIMIIIKYCKRLPKLYAAVECDTKLL